MLLLFGVGIVLFVLMGVCFTKGWQQIMVIYSLNVLILLTHCILHKHILIYSYTVAICFLILLTVLDLITYMNYSYMTRAEHEADIISEMKACFPQPVLFCYLV